MAAGTLYVVATPIGNLEDITLRALRILKEVDLVVAEDTRHSRRLFDRHGIETKLMPLHAHSSADKVERYADWLQEGKHIAIVSDAGTPLVSDPGEELIAMAIARGIAVVPIPGASAVLAALSMSGIPCGDFRFLGFLPRKGARRKELLASIRSERGATVLFESPERVADTLLDLVESAGGARRAAVCRELTKTYEEAIRGTLAELSAQIEGRVRGEVTIVIEGASEAAVAADQDAGASVDETIQTLLAQGERIGDIAAHVARTFKMSKSDAYARALLLRK